MSARIAWAFVLVTAVCVAADIATTAAFESLASDHAVVIHGFPFVEAAALGCAAMGALIVSRYPRHPIGWLLCVTGLTSSISLLAEAYAVWVIDHGGPGSRAMAGWAGWISSLLGGQLAISLIAILFLVAPDGRLPSPRWRLGVWVPAAGTLCCTAGLLTARPSTYDVTSNGNGLGWVASVLFSLGFVLISTGLMVSLVAMLVRFKGSEGEERRQLGFVAAAAALLVASVLTVLAVQLVNGGEQSLASTGLLFVAYAAMPLLLAIAVLRHRLYEIDLIVNRAVVLAVGTAFAGSGYVVLVVGVGALVGSTTNGYWASLGATAVVALAFQPLRRRVVRLANRLAYGDRAVPYLALADFNRSLAETPSAASLLPAVAEAAGRAVGAVSSVATLDLDGHRLSAAEWSRGSDGGDELARQEVQVRAAGAVLGRIAVLPRKGQGLRSVDVVLLQDLADQASQAFLNVATQARLAEHVDALDRTTRDLADSRRRIIEADDAARLALEESISREVLPHLTPLPERLAAVRAMSGGGALAALDQLVSEAQAALESLRELTRGIFPTQLARVGLGPPLRTLLARNGLEGALRLGADTQRRFPYRVETAVYFCCAELVRRPSRPSRVVLHLQGDELVLDVAGLDLAEVDLQGIRDRVDAAGGVTQAASGGTVSIRLPATEQAPRPA